MSHIQPCHIYEHATFTTMSHTRTCHIYNHATYTSMSYIRPCHIYEHVAYTTKPHTRPCHIYEHVIHATVSHIHLCHIYEHVTYMIMLFIRTCQKSIISDVPPCHIYKHVIYTTIRCNNGTYSRSKITVQLEWVQHKNKVFINTHLYIKVLITSEWSDKTAHKTIQTVTVQISIIMPCDAHPYFITDV